jgi:isoquinoline 1-oxidoreductase subunit beta
VTSTRRAFLRVSTSAMGGLWVTWNAPWPLGATETPWAQPSVSSFVTTLLRIEPDNRIIIGAKCCEIGQGVRTAVPMMIAEELDVPWSMIETEQLPYGLLSGSQPGSVLLKYGGQGVGGSTTMPEAWSDMRQAGAKARLLLMRAAADRWQVDIAQLRTADAHVWHADGRRLSYGELAPSAARMPVPPDEIPLKSTRDFRIIGQRIRTADARAIVTGRARYGLDENMPGRLVAVIARCPYIDGTLVRFDDRATRRIPGVVNVIAIKGPAAGAPIVDNLAPGIAVLAEDTWAAMRGREALKIEWAPGPWMNDSVDALEARCRAALAAPTVTTVRTDGNPSQAWADAATRIEAQYVVPFLAHATMEPPHCSIDLRADRARIVASTQNPSEISRMVSRLTEIPRLAIEIELPRSGGGFGRRLRSDFVAEAVLIAQKVDRPVKVVWNREDDLAHDFYRPFGVHGLRASIDEDGRITGWSHTVAATPRTTRDPGMADAPAWTTVVDPDAYPAGTVPHYESRFTAVEFGLVRGFWRAPLHTFGAFATESFIDEVALRLGRDPLAIRLELIGAPRELPYRDHGGPKYDSGRLAQVLREAARHIGWERAPMAGRGRGIACHFTFGGYAAHAMEVSVVRGEVRIHRCVCVADVGQPINPLGLDAQLMGGTIDGISTAMRLGITTAAGRVAQRNFTDYRLLTMAEAPDVEVHVIPSTLPPSGAGEMGIPSALPALTNAIAAATGHRIRRLPIGLQLPR